MGGAAALPNFGVFYLTTLSKEERPNWAW